ncbi:hypothetical protein [Aequorivita nionensis]|jgi:phenylacetate-CoA ligase|uniref:hypothetical protein n=1 Tax=Aequorivita nionensis TaxID=1287690 RepID=UPI003965A5C3
MSRIKYFNTEEGKALQNRQIESALKNLSFYKNRNFSNLIEFPIVNKQIINADFQGFVNHNNRNKIKTNTGGSSGNPFEFYLEKSVSRSKEKAHFDWYWGMFGYKPGDKVLIIRGESLAGKKLFEYQTLDNKLALSCYLLNNRNIDKVVSHINEFKPRFIHAYPSALKNFINLVNDSSVSLKVDILGVFLGSETLLEDDRELINSYFKAKIAHWYGQSERLIFAGNCPDSNDLHIFPFYGYTELVDDNDSVIRDSGIKGRIIATGFDNDVMPFIRYDTGDEAEYSENTNCKCGFKGKSFKVIHGRKQDYVYLKDGSKVSLTAFIFGQHFEEFSIISEIQLRQQERGFLNIVIVLKEKNSLNIKGFIQKLETSVQGEIVISLEVVKSIPKTLRGKHVFLIQNIKDL